MFVAWILNFQVNLRKIISLEPHVKLESQVDEVFFYQNMHFLHDKIIRRRGHRRRRKIVGKTANICYFTFLYL
jgi:hypothetical protein